jgi:hypothetical protein
MVDDRTGVFKDLDISGPRRISRLSRSWELELQDLAPDPLRERVLLDQALKQGGGFLLECGIKLDAVTRCLRRGWPGYLVVVAGLGLCGSASAQRLADL